MAKPGTYTAIRDLFVNQVAFALEDGKCDEAEALMLLGDVVDDLEGECEVDFPAQALTDLANKLIRKAQERG